MIKVLADRHHAGLWHSLELLGDRLGWDLYTPIGMDWWDSWYWSFGRSTYNDDRLARQYLATDGWIQASGDIWWTKDQEYPDRWIHGLPLAEAQRPGYRTTQGQPEWDIVIATLQDNQAGLAKFAREQGARFVVQVGNTGQNIDWDLDPIVLNSSEMPGGLPYHQEFDAQGVFGYREPSGEQAVRCFVHLLDQTVCFPVWNEFRAAMPDWTVTRYGHAPVEPDPSYVTNAKPTSLIAELMAQSAWGWHDKPHGDGFGHVLHGWAAIGRPLIGHASHYKGKQGNVFWQDGETCIDLDKHSVAEAAEMVRGMSAAEHRKMSRAIRAVFDATVDYDAEAQAIRDYLGTLVAA